MLAQVSWLLPIFLGVYLIISNNYVELVEKYITKCLEDFSRVINDGEEIVNSGDERIWSREELEKYDNLKDGLYLAILGQVFDVTKGVKHYGPGETYHPFTGRDGSLAFITGDFSKSGMKDDISSLTPKQTKALNDWVEFYTKNYYYKGKLIGNFYNSDGSPAVGFYYLQAKLKEAERIESDESEKNKNFPACNVEWKAETGSRVWCTTSSGGIRREWTGVPRMYFENPSSKQHRCACVDLNSKEFQENKANFREFLDCFPESTACNIILKNR